MPRSRPYQRIARDQRNGVLAQLVEHLHGMQGVSGSNPLSSTISFLFCKVQNTELKVSYKLFIGRKKKRKVHKILFCELCVFVE